MHPQHPVGRQVGGRVYYGTYRGTKVQRYKCLLVFLTVIVLLVGLIVTIVGHTVKPILSESSESYCDFCAEDRRATIKNTANCRIAGPIIITIGVYLLIFTICYFKRNKSETTSQTGGESAHTSMTYNQANQSVGTYPGTGQTIHPPPTQTYPSSQQYPQTQQYPPTTQPYPPTNQLYPQSQDYPPTSQHYPPAQRPYPSAPSNQGDIPPPPSYNEATSSGGYGTVYEPPKTEKDSMIP